ncbi:MAG: NAD(P)/FAD-dependent oxidoreductase [Christensenellales bacterium]|jgi:uncharacterized FAD-dependent dehydrogenase
MIKLEQIKVKVGFDEREIKTQIAKNLNIKQNDVENFIILKQAIDARKKPKVFYVLNLGVSLKNNLEERFSNLKYEHKTPLLNYEKINKNIKPVVVGFGPAGMFCGLALAKMGPCPIIVEQGKSVEEREKDVQDFWQNRKLNRHSNVVFGEGGAGTFSDGKLNTNLNNEYCKIVINELARFGAPKEIAYMSKPHIGSDNLKTVVKNLRKEIISLGGKVLFSHKLTGFETQENKLKSVTILNLETGKEEVLQTNALALCIGHSARDTFELLHKKNVSIKQKAFAMGVRIEQSQELINQSQYGKGYDKRLPSADYKLALHLDNGRGVFTFCMCPGGEVVASSSDFDEVVTNGMSYFARDKQNANSAVLVNVMPSDFGSDHPLAGVEFQRKYERLAFKLGGKNFNAPFQTVGSFLGKKQFGKGKNVVPTYLPGVVETEISNCLPSFVTESLQKALPLLNEKLKGFAPDESVLTAVESRSSSPVTIVRDENFTSNIKGIFPYGEGCGYAGGIVSSAQDGIKVAEAIAKTILI